jgi:acyl-CoA thioesterase-1
MRSLRPIFTVLAILILFSCGKKAEKTSENTKELVESQKTEKVQSREENEDAGVILFFGDSLTAGLGLDTSEAYPALIQKKLDSLNYDYKVVNAGLSGETTAGGKNRIDWVLKQDVDIFVLELGANDGLRGIPIEETRKNLQDIINTVKQKNANTKIILAGMQIPPNMGQDYTSGFRAIFPELAKENNIPLIPFLLEGVAGNPKLNQADGIHPTAKGYTIVAENVWDILKETIEEN